MEKWTPDKDYFLSSLKECNNKFSRKYGNPYDYMSGKNEVKLGFFWDYEKEYIPFLIKELKLIDLDNNGIKDLLAANRQMQREILKEADNWGFRVLVTVDYYLSNFVNLYIKRLKRKEEWLVMSTMDVFPFAVHCIDESSKRYKFSYLYKPYLLLKLTELSIIIERQKYVEEEEEKRRKLREEQKALKELKKEKDRAEKDEQKARESIEKSRVAMQNAKTKLQLEKYRKQIEELEIALQRAIERKERAISMAQQTRCGYVYVISNIGSFAKDIYKIGMTRRIDPMERVRELSNASVPFPFDVHTMIYTDDAPGLESHLHKVFDLQRVNVVNWRKEYFQVPLTEIRRVVEESGIHCEWVEVPEALQYHNSVWMRKVGKLEVKELESYMKEHPEEFSLQNHIYNYDPFEELEEV